MAKTRHNANVSPTPSKKKAKEKEPTQDVNKVASPIQHICRTCLEEIQASSLIPLNDSSSNIRNELRACIPEVDFDLVPNAGMCTYCLNALHVAYEFKQKCLQTEDKIRKQLHRKLLVDLTKLKKTNNMVQVSNEDGLGLDVVYINDPIEILDSEVETVNPFACFDNQISTPLLDQEIQMINSSVNFNNNDGLSVSSNSVQEEIIVTNQYLCNDDDPLDEDIVIVGENNGTDKNEESNVLLGLSESAPRKSSAKITVVTTRKTRRSESVDSPPKSKKAKTANIDLSESSSKVKVKASDNFELSKTTNGKIFKKTVPPKNIEKNSDDDDDLSDDPETANTSRTVSKTRAKTERGLFVCLACKKSFESDSVYIKHMTIHKPKIYGCNACKFKAKPLVDFQLHLKSCKKHKAIKSNMETRASIKKTTVKQPQHQYKCTSCKFVTPVQLMYKKHVRLCSDSATKSIKLQKPETKYSKVTPKTKLKNKEPVTKDLPYLKKKKKEASPSPTSAEIDRAVIEIFGKSMNELCCRFCGLTMDNNSEFETHVLKEHKSALPYSCMDKKCYFLSRQKVGLIAHMTKHYGDKPYSCSICTFRCVKKGFLEIHVKNHVTKGKQKKVGRPRHI